MKGQNLRLFAGDSASATKPLAKATNCSVTLGTNTESETNKDVTDDWEKITVVGKNWSIQAECQFDLGADTGAMTIKDVLAKFGTEVAIKVAPASGANNRVAGAAVFEGNAIITQMDIQAQDRTTVTASITLTGNGPLA